MPNKKILPVQVQVTQAIPGHKSRKTTAIANLTLAFIFGQTAGISRLEIDLTNSGVWDHYRQQIRFNQATRRAINQCLLNISVDPTQTVIWVKINASMAIYVHTHQQAWI
jgi:hypothetical protein